MAVSRQDPEANRKLPKAISPSDPCSAWTAKANKRVQFGYGLNYMIDVEHAVVVDVEATPARTYDEVAATRTMINRTETIFGLRPRRLAADTAYGTGKLLAWLLDRDITPHIPVKEGYERTDGTFPRLDFAYDAARDIYICPNGRPLRTSGTVHDGRARIICPTQETAAFANSRNNAPARHSGRSPATSTKKHAIMPAHLRTPLSLVNRATSKKNRDALCAPENPSPFRAHASTRTFRCTRRVPSRGHCAEPQDPLELSLAMYRRTGRPPSFTQVCDCRTSSGK